MPEITRCRYAPKVRRNDAASPRHHRPGPRPLAAAALAALLALAPVSADVAPPAPAYGLNDANTNVSPYLGVQSDPFVSWQIPHDRGQICSPALILDGRGILYAQGLSPLLAATGQPAGINIPSSRDSTPAIGANGNIYQWVSGRMHAFAPSGALLWSMPTTNFSDGNGVKIGPDGTIYGGGIDNQIYAFSPQGQLRHTLSVPGYTVVNKPPAIDAVGNLYVAANTHTGIVRSFDSNGALRWSEPWNDAWYETAPMLGPDGNLYLAENYGTRMVVRNADTGALVRTQDNLYGGVQAITSDGRLYSCSYQSVTVTDLFGNMVWDATVPAGVFLQDLVVDAKGNVYCTTEGSLLYAFSPTGDLLWQFEIPGAQYVSLSPVIGADGTLYVQNGFTLTAIGGIIPAPGAATLAIAAAALVAKRRRNA